MNKACGTLHRRRLSTGVNQGEIVTGLDLPGHEGTNEATLTAV